jgi:hypothetical protein
VGDLEAANFAEETLLQLETASEAPSSPCHSLLRRRRSMEHLDLVSLTPHPKSKKDRKNPFVNFFSKSSQKAKTVVDPSKDPDKENEDDMFDILNRVQGSR